MRILLPILALAIAQLFTACGEKEGDSAKVQPEEEQTKEIKIGDGIGSHAISVESVIAERIKELIAAGSDPKKPHSIEYHVAADTIKKANSIITWAEENGFEVVGFNAAEVVSGEWINFDLVKPAKLEIDLIWHDHVAVQGLAETLQFEYDGWGCEVVE